MPPAASAPFAHILIVDDEPALRRLMKRALSGTGTIVTEAANGREALELCGSHAFSAVITDVRMPIMDGIALVAELQLLDPGLPVIVKPGNGVNVPVTLAPAP